MGKFGGILHRFKFILISVLLFLSSTNFVLGAEMLHSHPEDPTTDIPAAGEHLVASNPGADLERVVLTQSELVNWYREIVSSLPDQEFILDPALQLKLGLPLPRLRASEIVATLQSPQLFALLSDSDKIAFARGANTAIPKPIRPAPLVNTPPLFPAPAPLPPPQGQVPPTVREYRDLASRDPQLTLQLLNGLHTKFGLASPAVTLAQLADLLERPGIFDRLDPGEKNRLANAAARLRGGMGNPQIPGFPPGHGPNHMPSEPGGDLLENEAAVLDRRVVAEQQGPMDCWAHAFGVTLQAALLGPPAAAARNTNTEYLLPNESFTGMNQPPVIARPGDNHAEIFRFANYAGSYVPASEAITAPRMGSLAAQSLWDRARTVARVLSMMTGGRPSPIIGMVIDLAQRLGFGEAVAMKEIAGQDAGGPARTVQTILAGMKLGIRFSGYFNRQHAMAIVGADARDNSVWVTDSMQNGRVFKISLMRGGHIDGMVAVVRRDLTNGVDFLRQL